LLSREEDHEKYRKSRQKAARRQLCRGHALYQRRTGKSVKDASHQKMEKPKYQGKGQGRGYPARSEPNDTCER